jgi:succinate dehydrogenase / fumarate reductase cytochrome b subunit
MSKPRPKHLDLTRIRLPVPGFVSILHRVSGAMLFLFIPLLLWLWQESLVSPQSFAAFKTVVAQPWMKIVLLGLLWGYLHHLCAGVRHLALDLDLGTDLAAARASSKVVLAVSIGLTVAAGIALW